MVGEGDECSDCAFFPMLRINMNAQPTYDHVSERHHAVVRRIVPAAELMRRGAKELQE